MTEQFLKYMDTPKEVRRQERETREHWQYRWFGMVPLAVKMWLDGLRKKK